MINEMESKVVSVSPVQAKQWLDNMGNNRKLRLRHVEYLSNEILSGHWQLTHQGIAFNEDGRLIDGQHRLAAIIKTGKTIPLLVTTNVHQEKYETFDRNAIRNMNDLTGIDRIYTNIYSFMLYYVNTKIKVNPADIVQIHDIIGGYVSIFYKSNPGGFKSKLYGSAPFKTAAIMQSLINNNPEYVFNLYKIIDRQLYDLMPPVAKSFCRSFNSGDMRIKNLGRKGRDYLYMIYEKAMYIFDENKANKVSVQVRDELRNYYRTSTIETVKKILNNEFKVDDNLTLIKKKEEFYKKQLDTKIAIQAARINLECNKLSMEAVD